MPSETVETGRTAANLEVQSESWERQLATNAVEGRYRGRREPFPRAAIVEDLLGRLLDEKRSRERQGLDHWQQHAQQVVGRLLKEAVAEVGRKAQLTAFYLAVHEEALTLARTILKHEDAAQQEAEDAMGDACERLLAGETSPEFFFRAVMQTSVDRLRKRRNHRRRFESIDAKGGVVRTSPGGEEILELEEGRAHSVPASGNNLSNMFDGAFDGGVSENYSEIPADIRPPLSRLRRFRRPTTPPQRYYWWGPWSGGRRTDIGREL